MKQVQAKRTEKVGQLSAVSTGRKKESELIRIANRAASVGRLMLGKIDTWEEFLNAEILDIETLSRRMLRSGILDIQKRLGPEIQKFCRKNFIGMKRQTLSRLYEEIKANRVFEIPVPEFEERFARVRPEVLDRNPEYSTLSISLWGLQIRTPEQLYVSDLICALDLIEEADIRLQPYKGIESKHMKMNRDNIRTSVRQKQFATRAAILTSFNLLESYLNGIAWEHDRSSDRTGESLGKKLRCFPRKISNRVLWDSEDADIEAFDFVKKYRDALVHSSPFPAPEKFGGHDKHRLIYGIDILGVADSNLAHVAVNLAFELILRIHCHISGTDIKAPHWLDELRDRINQDCARRDS